MIGKLVRNKLFAVNLVQKKNSGYLNILYLLLSIYIFFGYLLFNYFTYIVFLISIVSIYLYVFHFNKAITHYATKFIILVATFLVFSLLSALTSVSFVISIKTTLFTGVVLLIGIGLFTLKFSPHVLKYFLNFALVHAAFTLFSYMNPNVFFDTILPSFPENVRDGSMYFYASNLYAGITNQIGRNVYYLAVGFIIMFSSIISVREKTPVKVVGLIFLFAAILLTGKRGALLSIILSCFILIIVDAKCRNKDISKKIIQLGFIFIAIIVLLIILVPETAAPFLRFLSKAVSGDVTSGRALLNHNALEMFLANPLTGCGAGVFSLTYGTGVHNIYFQLLAENGLIGFIFFILILALNIQLVLRTIKKASVHGDLRLKRRYLYFSFLFQIFYVLYGFSENLIDDAFVLMTYLIAAAIPYQLEISSKIFMKSPNSNKSSVL